LRHDLLDVLLLVSKAILLLVVVLVAIVILVGVVILLPLGAVNDEVVSSHSKQPLEFQEPLLLSF
jgi:hypothetical protein